MVCCILMLKYLTWEVRDHWAYNSAEKLQCLKNFESIKSDGFYCQMGFRYCSAT